MTPERFRDVVEPVRIYCRGQETFALYIMSLGAWYCECCGKKVRVVW